MSKTKTESKTLVSLPDRNTLAATLKAAITVEDGKLSIGDEAYYASTSAAGLDKPVVDGVHEHDLIYSEASLKAIGEHAFDMFQVDGDMENVEGSADIGSNGNEITVNVHKSRTNRNPTTGEPVITFGATTVKLTSHGTGLNKVRRELKEAAHALWAEKE